MTGTDDRGSHRPDGKCSFDSIYDQADPSAYYTTLKPLRYQIPAHAQPVFRRAARAISRLRGGRSPIEMLDLCCGYGINGALINHAVSMDELYRLYKRPAADAGTRRGRLERDAAYFHKHRVPQPFARVTGIDVAGNALDYAHAAGLLDSALHVDLESGLPGEAERARLSRADLITVTGGLSYIGARTFGRLMGLYPAHRLPWVIAFPLRHTDFSPCEAVFERAGMRVECWSRFAFPHRAYGDAEERTRIMAAVQDDSDPIAAPVNRSHIEAVLYLARPEIDAERSAIADLVRSDPTPHEFRDPAGLGAAG
jgi:SAM-dependent methyltransferase